MHKQPGDKSHLRIASNKNARSWPYETASLALALFEDGTQYPALAKVAFID
ncbi:hypothetical protein [Cedecea colo]|uniref:hypothetical protein n=1 Tax=Cedecea colo TaxID=2552946 RepID=UPI001431BDE6|nr:hypothetical protein [Cedecea colo]